MPRVSKGDKAWLAVWGDPADGANCHEVTIVAAIDDKSVKVERAAWSDSQTKDRSGKAIKYSKNTIDGLELDQRLPGKVKGEGDGSASLHEFDPYFAKGTRSWLPGTYDDMMDIAKLSDPEMMRNLRERFNKNMPYCYCGSTLLALNVYGMGHVPPEDGQPTLSEGRLQEYSDAHDCSMMPPHIWAVASTALRACAANSEDAWPPALYPTHRPTLTLTEDART